jgi:hypothetical protein
MATPFETFVNDALAKEVKADVPVGGNFPAGLPMVTTGVGMMTAPTGPRITVSATAPSSPSVGDLWVDIS